MAGILDTEAATHSVAPNYYERREVSWIIHICGPNTLKKVGEHGWMFVKYSPTGKHELYLLGDKDWVSPGGMAHEGLHALGYDFTHIEIEADMP